MSKKKKQHRKVKEVLSDVNKKAHAAIKKAVGNIHQSIHNLVKDVEHGAQWLVLAPFKKPMTTVLKARGIKAPTKIDELAKVFLNKVVMKNNFERESFERDHADAAAAVLGAGAALAPATGGISAIVAPIIAAIMAWFKKKKEAKDAGATLPADEEKAVNEATDATDVTDTTDTTDGTPSETNKDYSIFNILMIVLAVFFLWKIIG